VCKKVKHNVYPLPQVKWWTKKLRNMVISQATWSSSLSGLVESISNQDGSLGRPNWGTSYLVVGIDVGLVFQFGPPSNTVSCMFFCWEGCSNNLFGLFYLGERFEFGQMRWNQYIWYLYDYIHMIYTYDIRNPAAVHGTLFFLRYKSPMVGRCLSRSCEVLG